MKNNKTIWITTKAELAIKIILNSTTEFLKSKVSKKIKKRNKLKKLICKSKHTRKSISTMHSNI